MIKQKTCLSVALVIIFFLAGCAVGDEDLREYTPSSTLSTVELKAEQPESSSVQVDSSSSAPEEDSICYFETLAAKALFNIKFNGEENDFEKVRKVFDYIIATTSYIETDNPDLTDTWKYQDKCAKPPSIYQVLSVSPLEYGVGSCEHYAGAFISVLEYMGYETKYVSGLTYSIQGELVDHAWVMVKLYGEWYHADPQLEDNAVYKGVVSYKYFLKDDTQFEAHHVWGKRLKNPDNMALLLPKCSGVSAPQVQACVLAQDPVFPIEELVKKADGLKQGTPSEIKPFSEMPPFPSMM